MDVNGSDKGPGRVNGSVMRCLWKWPPSLLMAIVSVSVHAQTVEYIHTDALGTPVAVTNSAGVVIERSEYEPYGLLLNRPIIDGPGFTGHVQDAATGLTYMQQRYYDPAIGRFLSVDPVTANSGTGANFNRYWYANNNPYKFIDPDGRLAFPGPIADEIKGNARQVLTTADPRLSSSEATILVQSMYNYADKNYNSFTIIPAAVSYTAVHSKGKVIQIKFSEKDYKKMEKLYEGMEKQNPKEAARIKQIVEKGIKDGRVVIVGKDGKPITPPPRPPEPKPKTPR